MKKIKFKVITLFPELIESYLKDALLSKAITDQIIDVETINLRQFSKKKYNSVDDTVFGGGDGMLIQNQPLELALKSIEAETITKTGNTSLQKKIIYLSPQGSKWNHSLAKKYNELDEIVLICGRYAGIDQRFIHQHVDEEISIGDYVLSGGELAALVLIESISRFLPGFLGDPTSADQDSFENGLLESPQFTKPQLENGLSVPAVLLSGNHQKISEWRKYCSIFITLKKRPDLLVLRQEIDWKKVKTFYAQMDHADKVLLQILDLEFPHGS